MAEIEKVAGTGVILEEDGGKYQTQYSVAVDEERKHGVVTAMSWHGCISPAREFSVGARLGKTVRLVLEDGREGSIIISDSKGRFTGTGPLLKPTPM